MTDTPTPTDANLKTIQDAPDGPMVQVPRHSLATVNRTDFTSAQVELLKRTIAKGATDDELSLFLGQCRRTGLDPFAKQIYLVKRWNSKAQREDMAIQVGIDGYRLIADRTGQYAGNDDPTFDNEEKPTIARVTVYKIVNGIRCAFTATARWSQYYPGEKQGFMWHRMPHLMLGKCAEALALRKAFPAELSGLYIAEELDQAGRDGLMAIAGPDQDSNQTGFITPDQIQEINTLLGKCDQAGKPVNSDAFMKYLEAESLDKVLQRKLDLALWYLNNKLKEKK